MKAASAVLALFVPFSFVFLLLAGGPEELPKTAYGATPSAEALADIPPEFLAAYQQAGERIGIDWTLIAGIGKVECDHGRYPGAGCNPVGSINSAGARGPMQFLGSTWRASSGRYDLDVAGPPVAEGAENSGYATDCSGDRIADPWNISDATCGTARLLKHNGAPGDTRKAVFAYNHADWYVTKVLDWANRYNGGPAAAGLAIYNPPDGWPLPSTAGKISYFGDATECQSMALYQNLGSRGSCDMISDPTLKWFVAMRWPEPASSYPWWRKQRILITNTRTNKSVVAIAGDWGPAQWTGRDVDVSQPVMQALDAKTDDNVTLRFVHPGTPAGPHTAPVSAGPTGPTGQGLARVAWADGSTVTVDQAIAQNLTAMIRAAQADGIILGGWGWRSPEGQIATRRSNCGTSQYAIYQMPSSACSPPTARPGSSQHERGLAIDFTYQGNTICYPRSSSSCQGNPAFNWMRAHAHQYGFINLPSEAWHWSTTGR